MDSDKKKKNSQELKDAIQKLSDAVKKSGKTLTKLFAEIDTNCNGLLDREEFFLGLDRVDKYKTLFTAREKILLAMYADNDMNKQIDYKEFVSLCETALKSQKVQAKQQGKIKVDSLELVYSKFDTNKDGILSKIELQEGLNELGIKCGEKEMEIIFSLTDTNKDGTVNLDEFKRLFENW